MKFYKDGILFSDQKNLYFNNKPVELLNDPQDSEGNLDIKNILIDNDEFYLSSSMGIFKNYRRIFTKYPSQHTLIAKEKIFVASDFGVYEAEDNKKEFMFNYNWQLMPNSPQQALFISLNKSQSNIEFASSNFGFYFYDSRKKQWLNKSHGLDRNFQDEFGIGRFWVEHTGSKSSKIYLPASTGVYVSNDQGNKWVKSNQGLESNSDGFYTLREILMHDNKLFLIGSTGVYYSEPEKISWVKINVENAQLGEEAYADYHSIAIKRFQDAEKKWHESILIGDSQGNVYEIFKQQNKISLISTDPNESVLAIENNPGSQPENSFTSAPKTSNKISIKTQRSEIVSIDEQNSIIEQIKEILSNEPDIKDVHEHALKFAGIPTGKSFSSYKRQARFRNVLPNLELSANKKNAGMFTLETDGSENLESDSGSLSSKFNKARLSRNDSDKNKGLKVSWNLGNIIYDPEVNDINTNARITANIRENLLTEITQIYFARKQSLIEFLKIKLMEDFPELNDDFIKKQLELEEYTAQIDARTGGWFSDQIKEAYI